jgi:adenosylhomocysteine nucleosidase
MTRLSIVTAMATEVWPLVRRWHRTSAEISGRKYQFFEKGDTTVLCGGIGYEAGHRAAEAIIAYARPDLLVATGLAGALRREIKLGQTFMPASVIDAATGRCWEYSGGEGVSVSSIVIAGADHKRELAQRFRADIVDMEGFAVAEVAHARGIPVLAAKAVSDELEFELPPLQRFVGADGRFRGAQFTLHAAVHPAWWPRIAALKRNSDLAARALARLLLQIIEQGTETSRSVAAHNPATHV